MPKTLPRASSSPNTHLANVRKSNGWKWSDMLLSSVRYVFGGPPPDAGSATATALWHKKDALRKRGFSESETGRRRFHAVFRG